jgi:hypothetical protein
VPLPRQVLGCLPFDLDGGGRLRAARPFRGRLSALHQCYTAPFPPSYFRDFRNREMIWQPLLPRPLPSALTPPRLPSEPTLLRPMFVDSGTPRSPSSLPPEPPPNRHAVAHCEPTPRKLGVHPSPSQVRGLGNPKITEQPALGVPSKATRRRPPGAQSEETPIPRFSVPCSWAPDPQDHRAACPPSPLQTDTPSSALEALWEGSGRPRLANIRRPVVFRYG